MTSSVLSVTIDGTPRADARTAVVTLIDVLFEILALAVSLALAGSLAT